jgi:predicted DCC family thiol-disulfide oxidoreductase YuxK
LEISNSKKIDLLYDSECPICQMEVDFLRKRDINNHILFTDLSSPYYNPIDHGNVQFIDGMRKIRAVLPDKRVITGVEAFRQTYQVIGLGWMFALTQLPIIGEIADLIYDIWAENRLRITGRGDLADLLKQKSQELREMEEPVCNAEGCGLDYEV